MKRDELTLYHSKSLNLPIYVASEVDKAIGELKARIDDLEKLNHDLCERVTENDEIRLHWEEIEQTRAENESLKAKLESVQASAYADSVDAGMRERKLRRELWLTRGAVHKAKRKAMYGLLQAYPLWEGSPAGLEVHKNIHRYDGYERKCLKKAEEYR